MIAVVSAQAFLVRDLGLHIGQVLSPIAAGHNGQTTVEGAGWFLPTGVYTPRQIVEGLSPLLEIVIHNLGNDPVDEPARDSLLDTLASNLAVGTRESSLHIPTTDEGRAELATQASKIGETLVAYAKDVNDVPFDSRYVLRSPCEGHLWTPAVARLIFGPRSLRHLAQLFNEYLHQMILLRDALLPIENYEEVIIPIEFEEGAPRGLRYTEAQRTSFIAELATKSITQKSVFNVARSLLAPTPPADNAYGFQYRHGVVLPAAVVGGTSLRLLRYIPSRLDTTDVTFEPNLADYYSAPTLNIPAPTRLAQKDDPPAALPETLVAKVTCASFEIAKGTRPDSRRLNLYVEYGCGSTGSVDVGQIARGWRYAHKASPRNAATTSTGFSTNHSVYTAADVLTKTEGGDLVVAGEGLHYIQAGSWVEVLGVLGKLYPDNTVLVSEGEHVGVAEEVGQGLRGQAKVVVQVVG